VRACVRACVRAGGRAGTGASGCNCTNLVCAQLGFGQASVDARPRVPDDLKRIVFGPSCQATYVATDKCKRTKCNMEREACNMQHPTNNLERFVLGPVMPQWRILSACNGRSYPNTKALGWTRHRQAQQTRLRVVLLVLDAMLRNQLTIRIKNDETGRRRPCVGSQHTACHTHGVHFVSCVAFFRVKCSRVWIRLTLVKSAHKRHGVCHRTQRLTQMNARAELGPQRRRRARRW
jgi:hypothetical protein